MLADLYRAAFPSAVANSGPLSQFALGCFLIVGDYLDREVLEKRFEARAAVALDDATELLREAAEATDPWEIGGIALKLTAIARAHDLLTQPPPQATPSQKRSAEKHDAEQAAQGVDSVRLLSPVLQDSESYQQTRRAAHARSGESDRKGAAETAQDESTDQLLRVSQAPRVYLPTGQSGPLIVTSVPDAFSRFAPQGRRALGHDLVAGGRRGGGRRGGEWPSVTCPASCSRSSSPISAAGCGPATTRATSPPTPPSSSERASISACTSAAPSAPAAPTR